MTAAALVSAKHCATAILAGVPSRLAACDANGKGRRHSAFSRGHHVHVVSNHNQKRVSPCLFDADASSLLNWRGLERSASFSRLHSHWLPSSSQATDRRTFLTSLAGVRRNSPERAVTGCAGAFHSANLAGANRLCVRNTLPNQHVSQAVADRLHHHLGLSKSGSSAGFKTSWKDLTRGAEALSPDDKIHD